MIKAICLTNSTEFEAIIGQIKNMVFLSKLSQFLCYWTSTWFYPTILSLRYKVQILSKSSYFRGQPQNQEIFTFSRVKWVNSSAAANTGHLITFQKHGSKPFIPSDYQQTWKITAIFQKSFFLNSEVNSWSDFQDPTPQNSA